MSDVIAEGQWCSPALEAALRESGMYHDYFNRFLVEDQGVKQLRCLREMNANEFDRLYKHTREAHFGPGRMWFLRALRERAQQSTPVATCELLQRLAEKAREARSKFVDAVGDGNLGDGAVPSHALHLLEQLAETPNCPNLEHSARQALLDFDRYTRYRPALKPTMHIVQDIFVLAVVHIYEVPTTDLKDQKGLRGLADAIKLSLDDAATDSLLSRLGTAKHALFRANTDFRKGSRKRRPTRSPERTSGGDGPGEDHEAFATHLPECAGLSEWERSAAAEFMKLVCERGAPSAVIVQLWTELFSQKEASIVDLSVKTSAVGDVLQYMCEALKAVTVEESTLRHALQVIHRLSLATVRIEGALWHIRRTDHTNKVADVLLEVMRQGRHDTQCIDCMMKTLVYLLGDYDVVHAQELSKTQFYATPHVKKVAYDVGMAHVQQEKEKQKKEWDNQASPDLSYMMQVLPTDEYLACAQELACLPEALTELDRGLYPLTKKSCRESEDAEIFQHDKELLWKLRVDVDDEVKRAIRAWIESTDEGRHRQSALRVRMLLGALITGADMIVDMLSQSILERDEQLEDCITAALRALIELRSLGLFDKDEATKVWGWVRNKSFVPQTPACNSAYVGFLVAFCKDSVEPLEKIRGDVIEIAMWWHNRKVKQLGTPGVLHEALWAVGELLACDGAKWDIEERENFLKFLESVKHSEWQTAENEESEEADTVYSQREARKLINLINPQGAATPEAIHEQWGRQQDTVPWYGQQQSNGWPSWGYTYQWSQPAYGQCSESYGATTQPASGGWGCDSAAGRWQ